MVDIDYNALLSAYQKKVTELINQNVVYEAKLNAMNSILAEKQEHINSLENQISSMHVGIGSTDHDFE